MYLLRAPITPGLFSFVYLHKKYFMHLIDTHCHIFLPEFDDDRDAVIQRALSNKIKGFVLPNIDSSTHDSLHKLAKEYPDLTYPLMGLHPTSVEEDYMKELNLVEGLLNKNKYFGIGEIGLDFYWDKTFDKEQKEALRIQLTWAQEKNLPAVIHTRDSFMDTVKVIKSVGGSHRGIFHCFSGSLEEANIAIDLGFHLGIGGVLTFKNSKLDEVIKNIDLKHIILETDSPYLAPAPKRGKRNEPAYLAYTANKLADIFMMHRDEIARVTSANACKIFGI